MPQTSIKIALQHELELLKQLQDAHDDPIDRGQWRFNQEAEITDADVDSEKGQQILNQLQIDNLLIEPQEADSSRDSFSETETDMRPLAWELTQAYASLLQTAKNVPQKKLSSKEVFVLLATQRRSQSDGLLNVLDWADVDNKRGIQEYKSCRNFYGKHSSFKHRYQEETRFREKPETFLRFIQMFYPNQCDQLRHRFALAPRPGAFYPESHAECALSYLYPIRNLIFKDAKSVFEALDLISDDVLFAAVLMLEDMQPQTPEELFSIAPWLSRYIKATHAGGFYDYHGAAVALGKSVAYNQLWGMEDTKPWADTPSSLIPLFKAHPQAITEVMEQQKSRSDIENTFLLLLELQGALPANVLTDSVIQRTGSIFSGLSRSDLEITLDCHYPQQFIIPLVLGSRPENYADAPSLFPVNASAILFVDERTPRLLCHLMTGYMAHAGPKYRSTPSSGFYQNEVLNTVVLPGVLKLLKQGFSLDEIISFADQHQGGLTLALFGLDWIPDPTPDNLRAYLMWAMSLLQDAGNNYPQTAVCMGMVAGLILVWNDPKARTQIDSFGKDAAMACLGVALSLLPSNRLDISQRLLPQPLPNIDTTALKHATHSVAFAKSHAQRPIKTEDWDGLVVTSGGTPLPTEYTIVALNLMHICAPGRSGHDTVVDWQAMEPEIIELIDLYDIVETLLPPLVDVPQAIVWQDTFDKLAMTLTYLASIVPINAAVLRELIPLSTAVLYPASKPLTTLQPLLTAIKENGGSDLVQVTPQNLSQVVRFAEFLMATGGGKSGARTSYLQMLNLLPLANECKEKQDLHFSVAQATQLEHFDKSLGPKLIGLVYTTPPFDPTTPLTISRDTLNDTFDKLYILTALKQPLPQIAQEQFVVPVITTINDLLFWFEITAKLRAIPGGAEIERGLTSTIMGNVDWDAIQKDQSFELLNVYDLQVIEDLRRAVNARTDNVAGDSLVVSIALGYVNRPVTKQSLPDLLRFARAWSQTDLLRTEYLRDVKGRYLMGATWAATKARDYLEGNYRDYYGAPDLAGWEAELARLGYPVRQSVVAPIISELNRLKAQQTPAPVRRRVVVKAETLDALAPDDRAFIESITGLSPSDIDLNNPFFADIRLDDLTTVEALRMRINTLSGTLLGDDVTLTLYNNELKKPLGNTRLDIEFGIFCSLRATKRSDPFGNAYRDLADFVGGRLVTYLKYAQTEAQTHPRYQEFVSGLAQRGFTIPSDVDDAAKALYHLEHGNIGYLVGKIQTKGQQAMRRTTGASDINASYQTGDLTRSSLAGSLPGFEIEQIAINGRHVATLITGSPAEGGRVSARVQVGGGVRESEISADMGDSIVFQAPVTMVSGANKGVDLMTSGGRILNPSFDPQGKDGYVIITPSGKMRIANKWDLRLSDLTGRGSDRSVQLKPMENAADFARMMGAIRSNGLTILTSLLFEDNGLAGRYTSEPSGNDSRRYILQFADGRFGMIDSEKDMSINDLLTISYRLGATKAVYCDTGMFDRATYYTYPFGQKRPTVIGWADAENSSNRIIFYSEKPTK